MNSLFLFILDNVRVLLKMQERSAFEDTEANEEQQPAPYDPTENDFLTSEDKFDLFCDFVQSDEWILPVQSFIDYFCIIFATHDLNSH